MGIPIPVAAALFATAFSTAGPSSPAASLLGRSPSLALRFDGGASALVTVRARIIRAAASIGRDFGPPAPRMIARAATLTAADGRAVPALIYDFE